MLSKLSILNTETNKLLILNSVHISNKLFSNISTSGKPTWRITYDDDDNDDNSKLYDLSNSKKGFGKISADKVISKKNKLVLNSIKEKKNEKTLLKSNSEISSQNENINKIYKTNKKEKSIPIYNNPDFEIIKSTNSGKININML